MKDINDIHLAGIQLTSVPTVSIDLYCAQQILNQYSDDEQAQRKGIEKFAKTVTDPLVKADIANLLSKQWNKDLEIVKEFLSITNVSTADEILKEFKDVCTCIDEMEDSVKNFEGITTGYSYFDYATGGLSLTDVFFIGARPGVGKTFVAMEVALHMAIRLKMNVLFFSLEMPASKLYRRLVANIMKISIKELQERIKSGQIDYTSIVNAIQKYIQVVDTPGLSIHDIEKRIQAANSYEVFSGKTQVVIIDYVQLMGEMADFNQFEQNVMYFKTLARLYNILLIPLSQMARTAKTWEEADISSMKGGGSLEQTGDVIWLMWKESENPKTSEITRQQAQESGEDAIISSKIAKARNGLEEGASKYIRLISDKKTTSVKEMINQEKLSPSTG